MNDQSVPERRSELRKAVIELRARGLNAAAKWAAEQLTGLPDSGEDDSQPTISASPDEEEDDTFLLAKSYFDLKVLAWQSQITSAQIGVNDVLGCRNIAELLMF